MRIAVKLAYDGYTFHGLARQPDHTTIEGNIIDVLLKIKAFHSLQEAVFRVASRTDKGVSCLGNVIAFNSRINPNELMDQVNPQVTDIVLFASAEVADDFYPRYAKMRSYRYYLMDENLDVAKVIAGANCFTGTHDFRNFARVESHRSPIRTIENIAIEHRDGYLIINIFAQTFLWHQVRRMISALEKIGLHKIDIRDIVDALENPTRPVDFGLAPSTPLILTDVKYTFDFRSKEKYQKKVNQLENRIMNRILSDIVL